jgi:hypothetical protein
MGNQTKTPFQIIDVSEQLQKSKAFDFENISKSSIITTATQIAEPILDGQMSPSRKMIQFMAMRDMLDEVISQIKPAAMDELKLSKGVSADIFGAKVEAATTAKYDYSKCGHSDWERLNQEESSAKEGKKKIEGFLKTLEGSVYLEATGEQVFPPIKTGSETIKVTFKNK